MFHKAKLADGERSLPRHQIFAVGIILSMLAGYLAVSYTHLFRVDAIDLDTSARL